MGRRLILIFIKFFIIFLFLGLVLSFVIISYSISMYDTIYDRYNERIEKLEYKGIEGVKNFCKLAPCLDTKIINEDEKYLLKYKGSTLSLSDEGPNFIIKKFLPYINKYWVTRLEIDGHIIFIDDTFYFKKVIKELTDGIINISMILLFLYIIYCLIFLKRFRNNANLEKRELEITIQRDITEMIHHELNVPVALVSSLSKEIYNILNETDLTEKTIDEVKKYLKEILFSADRINSILKLIGNSKVIKNTNGNVSLKTLLENTHSTVNSYRLGKISMILNNEDILNKYSLARGLTNGEFLNILYVMFNNSIEAKAKTITISARLSYRKKYINISLKDDGLGVREKNGRIDKSGKIFKYGVTTKSDKKICNTAHFFSYLADIIVGDKSSLVEKTGRGIGLYLNRVLLREHGGDIILKDTTKVGTEFLLVVPVKETEKHEQS